MADQPQELTVSVIIPAYNAEKYITKAIQSAMNQSFKPLEVIVADDGSSDRTADVAERCGAIALRLEHKNANAARNQGAAVAKGDILAFLDSDDYWEPNKLEEHVKAWREHSPSFIVDIAIQETPNGECKGYIGEGATTNLTWEDFLIWKNWSSGSSISILRKSYEQIGGFGDELTELQDIDVFIRAAYYLGHAYRLPKPLTHYILTQGSLSRNPVGIIENFERAILRWPFMSPRHIEVIKTTTMLSAARNSRFPACLQYYRYSGWPMGHIKFWRSLTRSILNRIK